MRKIVILLMIAFAGIFIASCVVDHVLYCPYCGIAQLTEESKDVYVCGYEPCGKRFGAKKL